MPYMDTQPDVGGSPSKTLAVPQSKAREQLLAGAKVQQENSAVDFGKDLGSSPMVDKSKAKAPE